jgi:hypothetical protein
LGGISAKTSGEASASIPMLNAIVFQPFICASPHNAVALVVRGSFPYLPQQLLDVFPYFLEHAEHH